MKKSYEVIEVENGFIIFLGSRSERYAMGTMPTTYVAKDMIEVGQVLNRLFQERV